MNDSKDPRLAPRRRKLGLAFAAFGLLLVVFARLLPVVDGDRDNLVGITLAVVKTNHEDAVVAGFSVTNAGDKPIRVLNFFPQLKSGEVKSATVFWGLSNVNLGPHQSRILYFKAPEKSPEWKARLLWKPVPGPFETWRTRLREKVGIVIPALKRDPQKAHYSSLRTNYSADFPH